MLEKLKKEAEELDITVSNLARQKLNPSSALNKILFMLDDIQQKLNTKINKLQEVKKW
jgi:predicted transcriptional regulator